MTGTNRTDSVARPVRTVAFVFLVLFREEWRLHATLFGGYRFLLVPVVLSCFAVGGAVALAETGTQLASVVTWLHLLAIGFGLYGGTAGFAGTDMLEDVFGEYSSLLATADTLPISRRRLLGAFLCVDAVYYGAFVVLPMAVAAIPFVDLAASALASVLALWLSLWLAFLAGMVVTVSAISIRTRGVPAAGIVVGTALAAVALWTSGWYAQLWATLVTVDDGPTAAAGLAATTVLVGTVALAAYDPTYQPPSRADRGRFDRIDRTLPTDDPLVAKSVVDLGRSSGGFAKPFVSVAILFLLVAALVGVVESITGIEPAPGVFFGAVLGLSAFTTYNWLTQFDDVDAYLAHPVSIEDVFRAKRTVFAVVGAPTAAIPYLVAVVWFGATPTDALVGAAVLAGYALYYYGLTVYVAGFAPNEFLFDGVRFGAFGAGVAVVLVPTLVAGFVVVPPTTPVAASLVVASVVLGAVGFALTRRATARWTAVYRRSGGS